MISFGMNLKKHKLLRKIVVSRANLSFQKLGDWGKATKYWFDPKHFWTPAKLENVIELKTSMKKMPKSLVRNEKIGEKLKHIEKLCVKGRKFNPEMILSFKFNKPIFHMKPKPREIIWLPLEQLELLLPLEKLIFHNNFL